MPKSPTQSRAQRLRRSLRRSLGAGGGGRALGVLGADEAGSRSKPDAGFGAVPAGLRVVDGVEEQTSVGRW